MKTGLTALFFLVFAINISAQNSTNTADNREFTSAEEFLEEFEHDPYASKLVTNEYRNVEGSPFISEDWLSATIVIDSARAYTNVQIKLNVYDNKIHFKDTEGNERMLTTKVQEVRITDSRSPLNHAVFISGFAPNKNVFFRVLVKGPKVNLLEKFSARKSDIKVFNGEAKLQFDVDKDIYYYSVSVKNMYGGTKKCSAILDVFGNDKKITDFAFTNGIRCNKKEDAIKLVNFYNSY